MIATDVLSRWIIIPCIVLFLVTHNNIFEIKLRNIDLNFSVVPIIIQMLAILILTEILKLDFFSHRKGYISRLYVLLAFILGIMNFYFCGYFVASWIAVYKNLI